MTITINERMIIMSYREMKLLLTVQHNYVTPSLCHPDEDEDPARLVQSISDELFNPSRLKVLAIEEALIGCGAEQHFYQIAKVVRAKILNFGPVIHLYKRIQPVTFPVDYLLNRWLTDLSVNF